jgi:hypothetical protein
LRFENGYRIRTLSFPEWKKLLDFTCPISTTWEEFADSVTVPRDGDETQPEQDSFTPKGYENMINAEIMIPKGDGTIVGKVIKRAKGEDGNPIGLQNSNPLLDTREYKVLMPDGATVSYTANVIAKNLYSQVDSEGR